MSTVTRYRSRTAEAPAPVRRAEPIVWGERTGGALTVEQIARYEEQGFLRFERLLDAEERATLDRDLEQVVAATRGRPDERVVREPGGPTVRSIFEIHTLSPAVARLASDPRVLDRVEQILGSPAYLHQTRVNFKPGLRGKEFYWHSDFETWHLEDGMPAMRAVSLSVNLTENYEHNGSLMIMPGSHRTFVGCAGPTPDDHYLESLRAQHYGTPSDEALTALAREHGITQITAPPGSAVLFDSNCMHGSNGNITPFPRRNLFLVYNSVDNALAEPFGGTRPRPAFIAAREVAPLR